MWMKARRSTNLQPLPRPVGLVDIQNPFPSAVPTEDDFFCSLPTRAQHSPKKLRGFWSGLKEGASLVSRWACQRHHTTTVDRRIPKQSTPTLRESKGFEVKPKTPGTRLYDDLVSLSIPEEKPGSGGLAEAFCLHAPTHHFT